MGRKQKTLQGLCLHLVGLFFFFLSRVTHWSALEHFWTQWAPLVWLPIPVPCCGSGPPCKGSTSEKSQTQLLFLHSPPPPLCPLICICHLELESNISMCQCAFSGPSPASVYFIYIGYVLFDDGMSILVFFLKSAPPSSSGHWRQRLGLPLLP